IFSFLMHPPPPRSTIFPYTTLFRSRRFGDHRSHRPFTRRRHTFKRRHTFERHHTFSAHAEVVGEHRTGESDPHSSDLSQLSLARSEEHTSELQSPCNLVCRLLLEKK